MNIIQVKNVSVKYGNKEILHQVSFDVKNGCIYGLVGHNGAGKTTLLRTLLGLNPKYEGELQFFESPNLLRQRAKIGAVMDMLEPEKGISALEYVYRICQMTEVREREYAKALLEKVGLVDCMNKRIGEFSLGMKRRLLIACALAGEPELLILDEPFNGIDPRGMSEMRLIMHMLVSEGMTILVTSHIIPELIKLADTFGVMHQGNFIGTVTSEEVLHGRVQKTLIKMHNPVPFIEKMRKLHPQHLCLSDSLGEVSVFGKVTYEEIRDACEELKIKQEDFGKGYMTGEEILLWKMEGHGQ